MADDKKTAEYRVAFDHIGIATGETVGTPPLATSTDHFKGDIVELTEADAKRYLETGAVVKASDPRAKHIQANPPRNTGVVRTIEASVPLEETAQAVSAGEGAARDASSEAELKKLNKDELFSQAAAAGVTVERTDTKPVVIKKILAAQSSAAPVGAQGEGPGETANPGQGDEPADPAPSAAAVTTE